MGNISACLSDETESNLNWPPGGIPEQYRVVGRSGATIRISENLDSPILLTIPAGKILQVDMVKGRRCRIIEPVQGWGSTSTEKGYVIIEKCNIENSKYKVVFREGVVVRNGSDPNNSEIVRLIPFGEVVESIGEITIVNDVKRVQLSDGWISMTRPPLDEQDDKEIVLLEKIE
eukprot:CAMPEP_0171460324 /NCGR_PEP_ID=MMETSP0945-20130129/5238_1 /TAXON_ID=109269 /ORGANISM="Vaucheria litorea, Strain CCMP2940" /LENGTH=173 /DNA_ID=CAMNT_0011986489 /DNA_START=75 /DNA_END=596 /DNA_ORIENTATION=+